MQVPSERDRHWARLIINFVSAPTALQAALLSTIKMWIGDEMAQEAAAEENPEEVDAPNQDAIDAAFGKLMQGLDL